MTIEGESVMMRGTIRRHNEGLPPFTNDRNQKGLLVSGIKAWGDAGNGTEGRYEYLLLSTDFFLYFLYTKGRSVLFL